MTDTEKVTYTGGGGRFSTRAFDLSFSQGETKEVESAAATWLTENHDFEKGEPGSPSDSGDATDEATSGDSTDADTDDSDAGEWMVALDGVGPKKADDLEDAGYATVEEVQSASAEDLAAVDGVSEDLAESIKAEVGDGE